MRKTTKEIVPTEKLLDQVAKYIKPRTTDITWLNGTHTTITGTNIIVINPIKIIVKKNDKTYVILSYGQYSKDENEIFLYDYVNKISWLKMIEILKSN